MGNMKAQSCLFHAVFLLFVFTANGLRLKGTTYGNEKRASNEDMKAQQDPLMEESEDVAVSVPIAFYPLNKAFTTNDLLKRPQYKATASNVVFTSGPYNAPNGAYQFSGNSNSFIEFSNSGGILDVKFSITLMCWVRPGGNDGPLFSYKKASPGWGVHIWLAQGGRFFNRITRFPNGQFFTLIETDQPLEVGKWVHVAATYNHLTGNNSIYVDGVLKKTQNIGTGFRISTNDPAIRMGVKINDGRFFNGAIAQMGIFNVSLTAQQILAFRNQGGSCPQGWTLLLHSCYKFPSDRLSWNASELACEAMGSTLAVVTSEAEQQALASQVSAAWIGLYRNPKDTYRWLWVDGTKYPFTNWGLREPNSLAEECAHMRGGDKRWNDLRCTSTRRYVCERNVSGDGCPDGWFLLQGSCYKFSTNTVNWFAANSSCEAMGSRLAVVKSKAVQDALAPQVTDDWIGLYRDPTNKNRWLWVDGTVLTYAQWGNSEPNSLAEECGHMRGSDQRWNDARCSSQFNYICERNVLPTACESSPCANGGTCTNIGDSFTCHCPQRFTGPTCQQVSNPCDSNPCKNGGTCTKVRSDLFKCACPNGFTGPRCSQDIDECQHGKGGCQDLCVNTVGGFYCACSDPEFSIAPDKRHCIAEGVKLDCEQNDMVITLPKSLVPGIDRQHLTLDDVNCRAYENATHFTLTTQLIGCKTVLKHRGDYAIYSNMVNEIPLKENQIVTRVRDVMIPFYCFYSKWGVVSSIGIKPSSKKIILSSRGYGKFTLTLDLFKRNFSESPFSQEDFPVSFDIREKMLFEVRVETEDSRLTILALDCFATPSQDRNSQPRYDVIKDGCKVDDTLYFHPRPDPQTQRFSLEAFKYVSQHPFVFFHCSVKICNESDPNSRCAQGCVSRKRRSEKTLPDTADDVYPLAQGPLTLRREKRDAQADEARDSDQSMRMTSGSTQMPFVAALAIVIGVCVVGISYMMYQKKQNKTARHYKLLYIDEEK